MAGFYEPLLSPLPIPAVPLCATTVTDWTIEPHPYAIDCDVQAYLDLLQVVDEFITETSEPEAFTIPGYFAASTTGHPSLPANSATQTFGAPQAAIAGRMPGFYDAPAWSSFLTEKKIPTEPVTPVTPVQLPSAGVVMLLSLCLACLIALSSRLYQRQE